MSQSFTKNLQIFTGVGGASVTAALLPNNVVSDPSNGGSQSWFSPSNAALADGVYTTASMVGGVNQISEILNAQQFGFAIPATALIVGVRVIVTRRASLGGRGLGDSVVKLIKGGLVSGTNLASGTWPAVAADKTYGGLNQMWGLELTPSDVNSATFGVALVALKPGFSDGAEVDAIKVQIFTATPVTLAELHLPGE